MTPLSIASDGLLDRGTFPTFTIGVRGYLRLLSAPVVVVPVQQPGGGGYPRPIIYLDDKGRPVDLKTYKTRTANKALQAAKTAIQELPAKERPVAREVVKALREAVSGRRDADIAEEARRLSLLTFDAKLSKLLFDLERAAMQEAEDDELAALLLLLAA